MLALTHFVVPEPVEEEFRAEARDALAVLAGCAGHLGSRLGRAADDPTTWVLVSEWTSVGAYRRALGSYPVKVAVSGLLLRALDQPSAFEVLLGDGPGGPTSQDSDRAGSQPAG